MNLQVTGIEVIELTDPQGLCRQSVPQVGQLAIPGPNSNPWHPLPGLTPQPQPVIPTPLNPPWPATAPYTGDPPPTHTGIWTKNLPMRALPTHPYTHKEKWGVGIPQSQTAEPDKWQKNWQAKMSPDQQKEAFDHGYTAITQ